MTRLGTFCLLLLVSSGPAGAQVERPTNYPAMAPIERYRIADPREEIALARSAAPVSISADADVLVLGTRGYETAVRGKNGFVCFVERSWAAGLDDGEFWNPKLRALELDFIVRDENAVAKLRSGTLTGAIVGGRPVAKGVPPKTAKLVDRYVAPDATFKYSRGGELAKRAFAPAARSTGDATLDLIKAIHSQGPSRYGP